MKDNAGKNDCSDEKSAACTSEECAFCDGESTQTSDVAEKCAHSTDNASDIRSGSFSRNCESGSSEWHPGFPKSMVGIKWRLIAYLLAFVFAIIFFLWVFQILLLDEFYKAVKTEEIKRFSQTIGHVEISDLPEYLESNAVYEDMCVVVYDTSLNKILESKTDSFPLIKFMDKDFVSKLYSDAVQNGGNFLKTYNLGDISVDDPSDEGGELKENNTPQSRTASENFGISGGNISQGSSDYRYPDIHNPQLVGAYRKYAEIQCLMYCSVQSRASGEKRFVITSSVISPVDAIKQTLNVQLGIIIVLLVFAALVMSVIISKKISKPIIVLNSEAKNLPDGNFTMPSKEILYKEISELAQTLEYAADEISKVDSLRKELISNVSHDLRTPLTLISGYSEVMRDIPGENTAENLQIIIDETNRLNRLVTDMLDISKLESGMSGAEKEILSLTDLVEAILYRYDKLVENGGYQIKFNFDEEVYVNADDTKMSQVVYNLVNNAINYCGNDKLVVVNQKVIKNGKKVKLEVIDNGVGIAPEKLPLIWDRYYKADNTHKRASVGSGLGLSIVKKVLELHGCEYGVESELGKGSCFWFVLDVCDPKKDTNIKQK